MKTATLSGLAFAAALAAADLPLPPAPVRVVVSDVKAFDAALTGAYRRVVVGKPQPGDPLLAAWRRSQVGAKLEDQWAKFSEFLPLTWEELRKLQPTSLGLALLEVGHLEAVLVLETPLAALPAAFPKGERRTHGGVGYTRVAKGAADGSEDPDRRMGLAWAHAGSRLFLATSERSLKLALDEAAAGRGFKPPLHGFVSMELDLDALRRDRYFRREFQFGDGPERGRTRAALLKEGEDMVELREGSGGAEAGAFSFAHSGAVAAGWEPQGADFWASFRRAFLDPIPHPADRPVPALRPLPEPAAGASEDRYSVDLGRPRIPAGEAPWEEGDLAAWKGVLQREPVVHWGWRADADGSRRMVFPWPAAEDAAFLEACRASIARRAGPTTVAAAGEAKEIRVGAGFPALALRRTGAFLWVAGSAKELQDAAAPVASPGLLRWSTADLRAVRGEAARWAKVEGPPRPEQVRPWSDRILGLLGWMPATVSITVERRASGGGWSERVRFRAAPK